MPAEAIGSGGFTEAPGGFLDDGVVIQGYDISFAIYMDEEAGPKASYAHV